MSYRLNYKTPELFKQKKLKAAFFYAHDFDHQEVDFSSPLSSDLTQKVIKEFKLKKLLVLNQTHSAHIVVYPSKDGFEGVDGVITQEKGVGLIVRHADCQAALIYDPDQKIIAAIHAGFRGQVRGIYTECLKILKEKFGSRMDHIQIALSPSLGLCHSEFINYKDEFPTNLHKYEKSFYIDLKRMARDEFLESGVLQKNIEIDERCTSDDANLFFSYRKNKTTKRLASLIALV